MSAQDALPQSELLARAVEASLTLATGALAAEAMDAHRAGAYQHATELAKAALQAAQALAQPAESPVVAQLVELTADLAGRVAELEQDSSSG